MLTVVPRAVGYGVVEARQEWQMVSEVSGRIVKVSPQFEVGAIVPKGTELLKVDPQDYRLAEQQVQAGVDGVRAQINELRVKEKSARDSLAIETRSLELARSELARVKRLLESGAVAQADLDREERSFLTQEKTVQNLQNTLRELPANRRVFEAQLQQQRAGLQTAEVDLARTVVTAPYDVRIREVRAGLQDAVGASQVLAVADGIEVAEIPAQVPLGSLRPLIPFHPQNSPLSTETLSRLPELSNLSATVRLETNDLEVEWEARFDRFTNVDSQTRTMGVVVAIDEPYRAMEPGKRPPVVSGMYMEVEIRGAARSDCLALPPGALHGDSVYLIDADNRLTKRAAAVDFRQPDFLCLRSGVEVGDRVVVTDLVPAIEGMLLDPEEDTDAAARFAAATGHKDSPE
ncbi:MAG: efflux RND transporter periplasmic adaptor subunit [bacterium]|nr:efflux RND transporter periplasmic adaptor subunit [bacterium]